MSYINLAIDLPTVAILSVQIFAIMDPLAAVPALVEALSGFGDKEARTYINRASIVIFALLTIFSTIGGAVLHVLGLDISYLKIAAGVLLMAISIDTLITGHKPSRISVGEYIIVPIATPLIVGPGTMTLLIASSKVYGIANTLLASYIAFLATYIILLISNKIVKLLGNTFIHGLGRFMSIIIASFAVEMFVSGLRSIVSTLLLSG
ncbi:MAG: MarC family protein [Ignisphaera sp.]